MSSSLEKLSQISIVIIALAAIFVSVWQVKVVRDHNKLSVRPLMDFHLFTMNGELEVSISNRGIGPAIIEKISYTYEGTEYLSWDDVLTAAGALEDSRLRVSYGPNTVLSPNSDHVILKIIKKEPKRLGIQVFIAYKSIYEEKFDKTFSI